MLLNPSPQKTGWSRWHLPVGKNSRMGEELGTVQDIPNDKFEYVPCPVCHNKDLKDFLRLRYKDFSRRQTSDYEFLGITEETILQSKRCPKCKFVFVNPRINPQYEQLLYNEAKIGTHDKFINLEMGQKIIQTRKSKLGKISRVLKAIAYADINLENVVFLDYGCGYGHSMSLARELEMEAYGVEIDLRRIAYCEQMRLKVATPQVFKVKFPDIKADIIFCENTLEHLVDPRTAFTFLRERSKKGTILYVDGLSPRLIALEKRRNEYTHSHFIEHLNYYPVGTLDLFMRQFGFHRIRKREYQRINLKDFVKEISSHIVHNIIGKFLRGTFYRLYEQMDNP